MRPLLFRYEVPRARWADGRAIHVGIARLGRSIFGATFRVGTVAVGVGAYRVRRR